VWFKFKVNFAFKKRAFYTISPAMLQLKSSKFGAADPHPSMAKRRVNW
tara:strand:+ start:21 stop:164 length:144 start_codon:yes stop_codon:yes gene_type:complete